MISVVEAVEKVPKKIYGRDAEKMILQNMSQSTISWLERVK
jgi:hypothetical protein